MVEKEKTKSKTKTKSKSRERKLNSDDSSGKGSVKTKKTVKSTPSDVSSCHSNGSGSVTKKKTTKKAPARSKSLEATIKRPNTPSSTAGSSHSRNSLPPIKRKAPPRSKSADMMMKSPNNTTHSAKSPRTPGNNGGGTPGSNHSRLSLPQTLSRKTPQRSKSDDLSLMRRTISNTPPRTPGGNSISSTSHSSRQSQQHSTFARRAPPPRSRSSDFVRPQQQQQQQQTHIVSQQFANHNNRIGSLHSRSEHLAGTRGRSTSRSPSRPRSRPNLNTASYYPPAKPVRSRSVSCERVGGPLGGRISRDRSIERRPQSGTGLGGGGGGVSQRGQCMMQRKSFSDLNDLQMMRRSVMDRSGHSTRSGGPPPQRGRSIDRGGSSHVPRGPSLEGPVIRGRSRSIKLFCVLCPQPYTRYPIARATHDFARCYSTIHHGARASRMQLLCAGTTSDPE